MFLDVFITKKNFSETSKNICRISRKKQKLAQLCLSRLRAGRFISESLLPTVMSKNSTATKRVITSRWHEALVLIAIIRHYCICN